MPSPKNIEFLRRYAHDRVWCPTCNASGGQDCLKPNRARCWPPHKARTDAARDTAGYLQHLEAVAGR